MKSLKRFIASTVQSTGVDINVFLETEIWEERV